MTHVYESLVGKGLTESAYLYMQLLQDCINQTTMPKETPGYAYKPSLLSIEPQQSDQLILQLHRYCQR